EPALGELIDGGGVLGEPEGMAERQDLHGDAELHASRGRGERRGDRQRRGEHGAVLLEVQLAEPDGVEAVLLGRLHLRDRFVEGGGVRLPRRALELGEEPELHAHALAASLVRSVSTCWWKGVPAPRTVIGVWSDRPVISSTNSGPSAVSMEGRRRRNSPRSLMA